MRLRDYVVQEQQFSLCRGLIFKVSKAQLKRLPRGKPLPKIRKATTMKANVYRDGKVHILSRKCATCIFRPGNLMQLEPGRVREMVDGAIACDSAIVCHDTLDRRTRENAVCRGFYDRYKNHTLPLRLTQIVGNTEFVEPPNG